MRLVLIPAGRFVMGTPNHEKGRRAHEGPPHAVLITRSFYLGSYEVTQEEFTKMLGQNPSDFKEVPGVDPGRLPVEQIVFDEAVEFCQRLSAAEPERAAGRNYRLPTEAEWEYACRAGTTTVFSCGDRLDSTQANFEGWHPYGGAERGLFVERPTQVGSYPPNPFGLYDMHGNVYEWVSDWYAHDYYEKSPAADPKGPDRGQLRVLRGGSWRNIGSFLRCGERYFDRPDRRHVDHGLRVACDVSPS